MPSRADHRLRLFGDRHLWQVALVAATVCVLSAGLVYVGYFVHVLRVARRAPCLPRHGQCVLLFGKHAPQGRIDRDFALRLDRAVSLWNERPPARVVLLGGGAHGEPSEAETARRGLFDRGMALDAPLQLEAASRDTLQNLRNARLLLLPTAGATSSLPIDPAVATVPLQVTLLSNRYHLARCALFARQLGFEAELCAAEPRLHWGPRTMLCVAGEAAYVCLSDLGTRWARLIGQPAYARPGHVTRAPPVRRPFHSIKGDLKMRLLQGVLVLVLLAFVGHADARRAPLVDPDPVAIPAGLSADQVVSDIKRALIGRGWKVTAQQPGQLESTLHLREHVARIRVTYDERQVRFAYVDSTNLDYRLKRGKPFIHGNYLGWLTYVTEDLSTNLQVSAGS